MKKTLCIAAMVAVFSLVACQMNNIRDFGGSDAAPVSTVPGLNE